MPWRKTLDGEMPIFVWLLRPVTEFRGVLYKHLIRPLVFRLDAEKAHHLTLGLMGLAVRVPGVFGLLRRLWETPKSTPIHCLGLTFKNGVGVAAGLDKNGEYLRLFEAMGFGFVEVGTVTPRAQAGNPKPRLFRLKASEALLNRMGFNNNGMEALTQNLERYKGSMRIGINMGKNKDTPNEDALNDYLLVFKRLYALGDYFVVNVSSPNTPGLRALQEKEPLSKLLSGLQLVNTQRKPLLLKIAPDLSNEQLLDILELAKTCNLAGVVATNTTLSRAHLLESTEQVETLGAGGISGAPLRTRSTEVLRFLHQHNKGAFALIGVGGISEALHVREKRQAGAHLVQVYSGLVYKGPALVRDLVKGFS
jgi:dihydroorotate dehydrogenase